MVMMYGDVPPEKVYPNKSMEMKLDGTDWLPVAHWHESYSKGIFQLTAYEGSNAWVIMVDDKFRPLDPKCQVRNSKTRWDYFLRPAGEYTPINRELWARVEALVRNVASFPRMRLTTSQGDEIDGTVTHLDLAVDEARAILAMLPNGEDEIDRKESKALLEKHKGGSEPACRRLALAAIRKGRELERGE